MAVAKWPCLLVVAVVVIGGHESSSPTGSSALAAGSGSATRSWIAFQRDSDVWIASPEGSETRLVAHNARDPTWSPDGRHIAFDRMHGPLGGVYVKSVDGGRARRLTRERSGTTAMPMSWSPNGRMIAFYRQYRRPGTCGPLRLAGDFFVMNADGSSVRRLTRHGQAHYWAAVWSPDSRRIAVVSCHRAAPRGDPEIYVIEVDGSGERRLTQRPGWDVPYGWSHDGRNLLVGGQSGGTGASDLYLLSADGRLRRNLTRSPEDEFGGAAWSPDQRRIAFVRVGGGGTIHVINADGSGQRSLSAATVPDTPPSWSPDGKRLTFSGWNEGKFQWEVHVMNADGTKRRNLTPGGGIGPGWSPAMR
jgi:Tol biopolymer transport system component